MHIAERVDKFTRLQPANLGDHHSEQGIGSNIERHAEKHIRAALVELAGEFRPGFTRRGSYIELKQRMTGTEGHLRQVRHIPGTYYEPPAVGVLFDLGDQVADLIVNYSVRPGPTPPLMAVDGTKVSLLIGPFI